MSIKKISIKKMPMPILNMKFFMTGGTNKIGDELIKYEPPIEIYKSSNKPEMPILSNKLFLPIIKSIKEEDDDTKCAPVINFKNGSCIPTLILIELVEAYNKYYKKDKIPTVEKIDVFYMDNYKKYLLSEMQERFEGPQKNWVNENFTKLMKKEFKEILEKEIFRPEGPKKQFQWMSSLDMNAVLSQYEHLYPDFKYLGSVPIDFDDIDFYGIKNIDYNEMKKIGKTRFAMVINNQKHSQGGQHWFCLYFDLKKGDIFFVDSVGDEPMDEIIKYVDKLKTYLQSKNIKSNFKINKTKHQKKNSECGIYSMYFILRFLKSGNFEEATKKEITDDTVNMEIRPYLFTDQEWKYKK
jgi:hypothetical protein